MQAIQTKFLGATNTRGDRIKATASAGSLTLGWDYALNAEGNHIAAARALQARFNWTFELASGVLADGSWVHVQCPVEPNT
jgi:hypothetical protein